MTGDRFVLVHGAHHGGWCWRRVAGLLRERRHDVFTPTLTGLGERSHLLTPDVGLSTMTADVVAVLEAEELDDVVLVGHSFGALPVLGAADREARRIRRIVLLDGLVVDAGSCAFDALPDELVARRTSDARRRGDGIAIPPPPDVSVFAVTGPDAAWVGRRLTPQPLRSYQEPLGLERPLGNGLPVTYLHCVAPRYEAIASSLGVVARAGFGCREIETGHDAMITAPELVVEELLR
jgi:pimeloyl-ACP methyl ester carboxylesterase